jgi:rhodanese-related sulfurtransferase
MTQAPGTMPAIDVRTAHERTREADNPALLLDVREPNEFQAVRAEGAILIPMSAFANRMTELPRDRPIQVICQSGNRSAAVTAHLLRNGWSDVVNVAGGTTEWVKAGLPTRQGPLAEGEGELAP